MSIKYIFTQKTRVFDDVLSLPTSNSLHISNPPQPYFFNQRTQQLVKDSSTSLPCSHISNKSCHQVVLLDLSNSPKSFQTAKLIGFSYLDFFRAIHVEATWGRECGKLVFLSDTSPMRPPGTQHQVTKQEMKISN